MYEKVNPSHPDKIADRIAGAIVDLAYAKSKNPKIAVEVLIGHGECNIIAETSVNMSDDEIKEIVSRIVNSKIKVHYVEVPQDTFLAHNQDGEIRCGDNGIFKGVPITKEQKELADIARNIYSKYASDGKYIIDNEKLIICQSNLHNIDLSVEYPSAKINPLGDWLGGTNVDTGATNRKLGSDMGDAVTGGGLHGKDLSKGDVSINIYAHLKAQATKQNVEISCAIGDNVVDGKPYNQIVEVARKYIESIGGFEKLAEWGLI